MRIVMGVLQLHVALLALLIGDLDDLRFHQHLRQRHIQSNQSRLDRRHLVAQHIDDDRILVRRRLARSAFRQSRLNRILRGIRIDEPEAVHNHRPFRRIRILIFHIRHHQIRFVRNISFRAHHRLGVVREQRLQPLNHRFFSAAGEPGCDSFFLNFLF